MSERLPDLQKTIVATVAYFDVFEYPLTSVEIWKWLYQPAGRYSLHQVVTALADPALAGRLGQQRGFYCLRGREQNISTRLERYRVAKKKFAVARRGARVLRLLAFVELVAVCNNVGYNNATPVSDVDFFIVVKKNRLWWTRLWVTLLLTLLRLRRHGTHFADRICLSFYVADDYLDLSGIALQPDDPYLVYWFATLVPIYDHGGTYERLLAQNRWLQPYLPQWYPNYSNDRHCVSDHAVARLFRSVDERLLRSRRGDWLEASAKRLQLPRVRRYFGAAADQPDCRVVISAVMLKFHKTDRRAEYRQRWREKLGAMTDLV